MVLVLVIAPTSTTANMSVVASCAPVPGAGIGPDQRVGDPHPAAAVARVGEAAIGRLVNGPRSGGPVGLPTGVAAHSCACSLKHAHNFVRHAAAHSRRQQHAAAPGTLNVSLPILFGHEDTGERVPDASAAARLDRARLGFVLAG